VDDPEAAPGLVSRVSGPLRSRVAAIRRPRGPEREESTLVDVPSAQRYDAWLSHFFGGTLGPIDSACAGAGPEALELFRGLDDDLWAVLLSREYTLYPNIRALLPEMPERALQERWNGWTGLKLLGQSRAFYARVRELCARYAAVALTDSRVLDFGCGWGRLTRFFARDVAPGFLFACDPVAEILNVCEETGVPAVLGRSDFVPTRLPFDQRFDLVFAFSVFTHLSEPAHEASLRAIHASLHPGGLLVLTVRPPAYLVHCERMHPLLDSLGSEYLAELDQPRYLFVPHPAEPDHPQLHGTEMTYGETVISLPYMRQRWAPLFELLEVGLQTEDMHQVVVTLRRRS
jgi:SAM-dependent methyltransferase